MCSQNDDIYKRTADCPRPEDAGGSARWAAKVSSLARIGLEAPRAFADPPRLPCCCGSARWAAKVSSLARKRARTTR